MAELYLDSNVAIEVADWLQASGHVAATARELRRENDSDDEHLLAASQYGYIFVTHNESDFVLLHDAWIRWAAAWHISHRHAGILIVPQGTKYGIDWDPKPIADAILIALRDCGPREGEVFRRKQHGWERRQGKDWKACASG